MDVGEILDRKGSKIYSVRPDQPAREAVSLIAARNIGCALVTDAAEALLGIVSERDLTRALSNYGPDAMDFPISKLMTRSVITCARETPLSDALYRMGSHRIRHLPVVRGTTILGLISIRDVLEFRMEALEEHLAALVSAEQEACRAREEAELSNRAKTEFLSNVSHELKTPLTAIIGFAEVLTATAERLATPPEYERYLHEIEKNGRHLLEIVDNLLDLSRIEIGDLNPREEAVSITEVVSTCVNVIAERADRRGVVLRVETGDALPTLAADKRMTKQMLLNLLANAVKFTPEGGMVSVRCSTDAEGAICFSVTDTGIGIAPEHLTRVVEPFYQAEGSFARRYGGAGLGLTLVNAMMQAHGGMLGLDSAVGAGTAATLRFPPERTLTRHIAA